MYAPYTLLLNTNKKFNLVYDNQLKILKFLIKIITFLIIINENNIIFFAYK